MRIFIYYIASTTGEVSESCEYFDCRFAVWSFQMAFWLFLCFAFNSSFELETSWNLVVTKLIDRLKNLTIVQHLSARNCCNFQFKQQFKTKIHFRNNEFKIYFHSFFLFLFMLFMLVQCRRWLSSNIYKFKNPNEIWTNDETRVTTKTETKTRSRSPPINSIWVFIFHFSNIKFQSVDFHDELTNDNFFFFSLVIISWIQLILFIGSMFVILYKMRQNVLNKMDKFVNMIK
jgi:hypothetical protein